MSRAMRALPRPRSIAWIEERSIPEPNTGCWLWMLSTKPKGYGHVTFHPIGAASQVSTSMTAHAVAYRATGAEVPRGHVVVQTCRQRLCVNPMHLRCISERGSRLRDLRDRPRRTVRLSYAIADEIRREARKLRRDGRQYLVGLDRLAPVYGISTRQLQKIVSGKAWNAAELRREEHRAMARHAYGAALWPDITQTGGRRWQLLRMQLTRPEDFDAEADRISELQELSWLVSDFAARRGQYEAA